MTFLLTPPTFPSKAVETAFPGFGVGDDADDDDAGGGGGTYETGWPVVAVKLCASGPNATVLVTALAVASAHVTFCPDRAEDVRVLVSVDWVVLWREAGQLIRVGEMQLTPVYVYLVVVVVVVKPSCLAMLRALMVGVGVALGLITHNEPICVFQIGMVVSGAGPQVLPPISMVAPAAAPIANWYACATFN